MEEHSTVDYEGVQHAYHHVCYRESGSPQTRTVGTTIDPPPECVDYFERDEKDNNRRAAIARLLGGDAMRPDAS